MAILLGMVHYGQRDLEVFRRMLACKSLKESSTRVFKAIATMIKTVYSVRRTQNYRATDGKPSHFPGKKRGCGETNRYDRMSRKQVARSSYVLGRILGATLEYPDTVVNIILRICF